MKAEDPSLLETSRSQNENFVDVGASSFFSVIHISSASGHAFVGGSTNLNVPEHKSQVVSSYSF